MTKLISILGGIIALPFLSLGGWHIATAPGQLSPEEPISANFKGRLLAASDADMIAYGYANGITDKLAGIEDSLALIDVISGTPTIISQYSASNSVISWPDILAWHPEHHYVYVAETRGQIAENPPEPMKDVFQDFPTGKKLTVIDYTNPSSPQVVQEVKMGENLQGVSLNRNGTLLASAGTIPGKELIIATLKAGKVISTHYFPAPAATIKDPKDKGIRNIVFHPEQDVVATNLNGNSVAFFRVIQQNGEVSIEQIGNPVYCGKKLSVGNWHPSGRFFMVTNVNWGSSPLGAVLNGKGSLINVAFREDQPHYIAGQVKTGLSPEGFDLSPDGKYAISVNMERTYLPKNFWFIPARSQASLSLVKINPETGSLNALGKNYAFNGALPEDAVFDTESNSIAVAVYHAQHEEQPRKGWIDFWEIKDDQLHKTDQQLKVTRGVHNLLLIP